MEVHAKKRSFNDPRTLKLRTSQWNEWETRAPIHFRHFGGRSAPKRPRTPKVDEVELRKAMQELERRKGDATQAQAA